MVSELNQRCIWVESCFVSLVGVAGVHDNIDGYFFVWDLKALSLAWIWNWVSLSLASELERCSTIKMAGKLTMLVMSLMTILSTVHSGTHLGITYKDFRNMKSVLIRLWFEPSS